MDGRTSLYMIRVQNSWEMSSRTRQELQAFLTMPIDSQSPWQNGKTERAGQSFKHQLWDLDEECHIEGETEFEAAVAECCDARNRYCNRSGFSRINVFLVLVCVYLKPVE